MRDTSDGPLFAMHFYGQPKRRFSAVLMSYADESGMHGNDRYPYVVFAGYWAPQEKWESFNADWSGTLRDLELRDGFHMTDFLIATKKPYCDWPDDYAERAIERLTTIIIDHRLSGFSLNVSWKAYREILSPPVQKRIVKHPYVALFDTGVRMLLDSLYWLKRSVLEREKLAMFFGQNQYRHKAEVRYQLIKRTHPGGANLVEPAVFASTKEFLPLQAADILANISRSFVRGKYHSDVWNERTDNYLKRIVRPRLVAFRPVTRRQLELTEERYARKKG